MAKKNGNFQKPYDRDRRPDKILDALHDVVSRYPEAPIAIYPLMDTIQLLIQKPAAYTIIAKQQGTQRYRPVFTTFLDPQFFSKLKPKVFAIVEKLVSGPIGRSAACFELPTFSGRERRFICAHELTFCDGEVTFESLREDDAELLEDLFNVLAETERSEQINRILDTLEQAANWPDTENEAKNYIADSMPSRSSLADSNFVDFVRPIVSLTLADLSKEHALVKNNITNVFFVIRRSIDKIRSGFFDYTAQIVLADSQQEQFRQKFGAERERADRLMEEMETPLELDARSIADSVFSSGSADFIAEPLSAALPDHATSRDKAPSGQQRQLAETALLNEIADLGDHLFYVPVHVGGVAWISLLTLKKEETISEGRISDSVWTYNYLFYRTLVPQICERVRVVAKNVYRENLCARFRKVLHSKHRDDDIISIINEAWEELAAYIPYSALALIPSTTKTSALQLPGGTYVQVEERTNQNSCFQNPLQFDEFGSSGVAALVDNLKDIVLRADYERRIEDYAMRTAASAIMSRNMSHNIGSNPLARQIKKLEKSFSGVPKTGPQWELLLFLTYIRDRMDYLAEIATAAPSWGASTSLYRVCEQFNAQTILLSGLTRLEGRYRPHCRLQIEFDPNLQVLMPHGLLGIQALYSIFENLIRNSVQNSSLEHITNAGILKLTAKDCGDCVELKIIDLGRPKDSSATASEIKGDLASEINDRFRGGYYEASYDGENKIGRLSPYNWGLKEMKISAAFLRLQPGWVTDNLLYETNGYPSTREHVWIYADWEAADNSKYLGYKLFLLKPKLALIVGAPSNKGINSQRDRFMNVGVEFDTSEQFISRIESEIFTHPYIVIDVHAYDKIKTIIDRSRVRPRLPMRVLNIDTAKEGLLEELIRNLEAGADAAGKLETTIARAWNHSLAKKAGLSSTPKLVLATLKENEPPPQMPPELSHVIWREIRAIAKLGAAALDDSAEKFVIYQRHSNTEGAIDSALTKEEQDAIWRKTLAYIGLWQGDDVSLLEPDVFRRQPVISERLLEAGLVWVTIIDEKRNDDENMRKQLRRAGILVVPLTTENIGSELNPNAICDRIQGTIVECGCKPGLMIVTVHLAILKSYSPKISDWFDEMRTVLAQRLDIPVELATHSGRGSPPELQQIPDVRFIEFSNLDGLSQKPSDKMRLVNMFMTLRRNDHGDPHEE